MSFETVLIANRGEIALRIIEACRELDLRSVVVYSEADADMPYLKMADASVCIGPAAPTKSYLNIASIISAVELIGAEAIHPGYGFLAENPHFVEVCEEHDLVFVGPSSETMRRVGDKTAARETVEAVGVPVLPGAPAPESAEALLATAEEIGYPLLVKSVFGGGGRGMRFVSSADELVGLASAASAEARAATGDGSLYLEKAVVDPRHVEVQIFADAHGATVHLGERDCTVQRRHQKLIEESPAPELPEDLRRRLHEAAILAAEATGYRNAGTVEFLLDRDGAFYFLEMNARIQVEHSVSEVVTGTNLIKEQLEIAMGEPLRWTQDEVSIRGHAIECRITAEDPSRAFTPSCGTAQVHELPGGNGVRIDTALYDGMVVSPHYDSLIAKVITWGHDREEARVRMMTALERVRVSGISTTSGFLREVIADAAFRRAELSANLVDQIIDQGSS